MAPNPQHPSEEHRILSALRRYMNTDAAGNYRVGVGDDAAVRHCCAGEKLVVTADALVQDMHFSLRHMSLREVGYKAMAVNLSDCAAMGATPDSALVQIVFPHTGKRLEADLKELYRGMHKACTRWRFPIVGGNLARGAQWVVDVTLMGRIGRGGRALTRTGARTGDRLWVSGRPGESGAGLALLGRRGVPREFAGLLKRHTTPQPRVALGVALGKSRLVRAAIDVSDGIARECHTLSYENNLRIELDLPESLASRQLQAAARRLGRDWRDWYLGGGEDYELLVAASPRFRPESFPVPLRCIGLFSGKGYGVSLRTLDGGLRPARKQGWDHAAPRR